MNRPRTMTLFLVQGGTPKEIGHTQNVVQRRPGFPACSGKKYGLSHFATGPEKLPGALGRFLFEVWPARLKFIISPLNLAQHLA